MENFTKGEWVAFYPHKVLSEGLMSVETNGGKLICKAELYKSTITEVTANAHLISAAPEMYAMLNSFLCLEGIVKTGPIIKLLAKARGESCGK